ncbi:hypothetical protein GCM10029976_077080 [Kribbella albertanoniae]
MLGDDDEESEDFAAGLESDEDEDEDEDDVEDDSDLAGTALLPDERLSVR